VEFQAIRLLNQKKKNFVLFLIINIALISDYDC
jgi:hypothetical protein